MTTLINYTFAQIGSVRMYATGDHLRKPVPSGGARHPIEAYLIVYSSSTDIDTGIYHYNVKSHRLDQIQCTKHALNVAMRCSSLLPTTRNRSLEFTFIHTCRFERSMFRYRDPRSYRVMQFDLGHIHANLCLSSRAMGLQFAESYSVPESPLESILKLNPTEESVMSSFTIINGDADD